MVLSQAIEGSAEDSALLLKTSQGAGGEPARHLRQIFPPLLSGNWVDGVSIFQCL
jgi:hypothetical protein